MNRLQTLLCAALADGSTLEGETFRDECAELPAGRALECAGCTFERCTFSDFDVERCYFVDCAFVGCDLSGLRMASSLFSRTHFKDCRMTGLTIVDGILATSPLTAV